MWSLVYNAVKDAFNSRRPVNSYRTYINRFHTVYSLPFPFIVIVSTFIVLKCVYESKFKNEHLLFRYYVFLVTILYHCSYSLRLFIVHVVLYCSTNYLVISMWGVQLGKSWSALRETSIDVP